jgi:hypothetical protein
MKKSDLVATAHVALLGCVTPTLRALKMLFSEAQKKVFLIAYFDSVPKVFERELIEDVSGEIECSFIDSKYECRAIFVYSPEPIVGSSKINKFEDAICNMVDFSEICYLRFGEEGGYEDLNFNSHKTLNKGDFYILE